MITSIKNKFISLLQMVLVFTYIVFEEIIWEGIAKPIYAKMHALQIVQRIEVTVEKIPPYGILFIFILLLLLVQGAGLLAGILFLSGQLLLGLSLYLSKIPIAAFTFWIFRISEDKLMQFAWFKWLYEKLMSMIDWLKSREVYINTMKKLKVIKEKIRASLRALKMKYFSKESPFVTKLKSLYTSIKASLKK